MMFGMMLALPDNQMQYNLQLFLNNAQSLVGATMLCLASVLIFYPVRNRGKVQRIERHAGAELRRLQGHLRADRFAEWEDRLQERVGLIDRIASLKGTVVATESIKALLVMLRVARCFRRQNSDLKGLVLSKTLRQQLDKAEWFWSRQIESPERFQQVALGLVDALMLEARNQPAHQLELQAAAQEWRMIAQNNQMLASLPC